MVWVHIKIKLIANRWAWVRCLGLGGVVHDGQAKCAGIHQWKCLPTHPQTRKGAGGGGSVLSDQPALSGHLAIPHGWWLLNTGLTVHATPYVALYFFLLSSHFLVCDLWPVTHDLHFIPPYVHPCAQLIWNLLRYHPYKYCCVGLQLKLLYESMPWLSFMKQINPNMFKTELLHDSGSQRANN